MNPLIIYLIDPVHNYISSRDNWMIPLNVLSLATSALQRFGDKIQIRCFKFPDEALEEISKNPPNIVGCSNYIWNEEISKLILNFTKKTYPHVLTIMGGPNIIEKHEWMESFLKSFLCDFYIQGEGEEPFCALVAAALEHGCDRKKILSDPRMNSIWYYDIKLQFIPANPLIQDLDTIPSPFTAGLVDEFFEKGLTPTLETNRGCPFSCTYCVWGNEKGVRHFSVDRVKSDIDYCRQHAQDDVLMINDANFGLYDRDFEIAQFIRQEYHNYNWPQNVIVNWGQVRSERSLEIADILKEVCLFRQSSQSMSHDVLKNIKRKNISENQWRKSIKHSKNQGVESFGELILMLPGETFESYLDGLRTLFNYRVDCINTNQLQLLNGAFINTEEQRKKYGMKSKWRLFENAYGKYKEHIAIEGVELVCETNTFSEEECYLTRPLSWLIQMSWTLHRHDLIVRLLSCIGHNPTDFFLRVIQLAEEADRSIANLFKNFMKDTREELFETKDSLIAHYSKPKELAKLQAGDFKKLNTHYSSYLPELNKEFIDLYHMTALRLCRENTTIPNNFYQILKECCIYQLHRNIDATELKHIESGNLEEKYLNLNFDFLSWGNEKHNDIEMFRTPRHIRYRFYIDPDQRQAIIDHMKKFSGISREYQLRKLHEPFYGINKKHLLFRVEAV